MRKVFFIITVLVIFFSVNSCFFDSDEHTYENRATQDDLSRTEQNDLSHTQIQAIFEDSKGYLWIGTKYLLSRYDGYEFKVYDKSKFIMDDLPPYASVNVISDIYETRKGELLVATEEGGIFKFNDQTDFFEPYLLGSLSSLHVQRILEDKSGNLWLGYAKGEGIEKWNSTRQKKDIVIQTSYINDIYEDSDGTIWIASNDGLFKYEEEKSRLDSISGEIIAMVELPGNRLLVGNSSGIFIIDRSSMEIINKEQAVDSLALGSEIGILINDAEDNSKIQLKAIQKTDSLIWIGTADSLYCYSIATKKLTTVEEENLLLSYPIILRLGVSKKANVLWVGLLHSGIKELNLNKPVFTHINIKKQRDAEHILATNKKHLSGNSINTILEESEYVWIGYESGGGVDKLDKNSLLRDTAFFNEITRSPFGNSSVTSIVNYSAEKLLICTWDKGAYLVEKTTGKSTPLDKQLEDSKLWYAMEDMRGQILIASMGGIFSIKKGMEENDTLAFVDFYKDKCWHLFEDRSDSTVWIGTQKGLVHYFPQNGTHSRYEYKKENHDSIPENYITFITQASPARLWVATCGGGVFLFDKKERKVVLTYSEQNGLPSNAVNSLELDRYGNLWIATNKGLCVIEQEEVGKKSPVILTFNESQGMQSREYKDRACCKGAGGRLYFGGVNGLNIIYGNEPEAIKSDPARKNIKIMVTGFDLTGKNSTVEDTLNIQKVINLDTIQINLKNDQQLALHFAVIDFISNKEYNYSYSITNSETADAWMPMNKSRIVNFKEPSGDYVLKVKAETTDGRNTEVKKIRIHIPHTPWEKWGIYIMLGIGIVLGGVVTYILISYFKTKKYRESLNSVLKSIYKIVLMKEEKTINPLVATQKLVENMYDEFYTHFNMDYLNIGLWNKEKNRLEFPRVSKNAQSEYECSPVENEDIYRLGKLCFNLKKEVYIKNRATSILFLPLKNDKQDMLGVITMQSFLKNGFNTSKRSLFQEVSPYVGETLTKILEKINMKEKLAITDTCLSILRHDTRSTVEEDIPNALEKLQNAIQNQTEDLSLQTTSVMNLFKKLKHIFRTLKPKLSAEELPVDKSYFNLKSVFETLRVLENNLKPEVKLNFDKNESFWVRADKFLVEVLLRNLIENAIRHTRKGTINIYASEYDENFIQVSVSDTGEGMTDELIKTIFEVGNRAKGEKEHGFGLFLCYNIIKKHAGCKIGVASEIGKGSTFFFTLEKANINE